MSIAYYNGKICKPNEVTLSLTDRAVFFGDGIYDAAIGRNGRIYLLAEHLARFYKNQKRLGIPFSMTEEALGDLLLRLASECGEECYFVYFQLSRYSDMRMHACRENSKSNLLITVTPINPPNPNKKLRLITYPDMRYGYCDIKTLNLLPSVMASTYAEGLGADEAVFIRDGNVTECAHSNISIIKNGELITHPTTNRILPGIMRGRLIETCREMGINCHERPFSREELFAADEVIVSSSTKLFSLATEIDGVKVGKNFTKKVNFYGGEIGANLTKTVNFQFVNMTE